jgi:hypothetical protein
MNIAGGARDETASPTPVEVAGLGAPSLWSPAAPDSSERMPLWHGPTATGAGLRHHIPDKEATSWPPKPRRS